MSTRGALALSEAPAWSPLALSTRELEGHYQRSNLSYLQEQLEVELEPAIGAEVDYRSTPAAELPDVAHLVTRLLPALLEVMAGVRPLSQVSKWLAPGLRGRIADHHTVALRRGLRPMHPPRIRRVHVCVVHESAVEVSVVVAHQGRVRACALRLSGVDGRWLVTALEMA